jgi:hypothetical protein
VAICFSVNPPTWLARCNRSNAALTRCTFDCNSAGGYGGGICNSRSGLALTICTFSYNVANCGGVHCETGSDALITNCAL